MARWICIWRRRVSRYHEESVSRVFERRRKDLRHHGRSHRIEAESPREEFKARIGRERGAGEYRRLYAAEEVLAENRREVERDCRYSDISFSTAQLDPPDHRLALCRRTKRALEREGRSFQPAADRHHLTDKRQHCFIRLFRAFHAYPDHVETVLKHSDLAEQICKRDVESRFPNWIAREISGGAAYGFAAKLEVRVQQIEQQRRLLARGVDAGHQSLPNDVEARCTEKVRCGNQAHLQRVQEAATPTCSRALTREPGEELQSAPAGGCAEVRRCRLLDVVRFVEHEP